MKKPMTAILSAILLLTTSTALAYTESKFDPNNQSFTIFVGEPPSLTNTNIKKQTFYQAILNQLKTGHPFKINRIVMITTPPVGTTSAPGLYTIGPTVDKSGAFIKDFISQIKDIKQNSNPDLEVFVMPDVESDSAQWSDWKGWQNVAVPSCASISNLPSGSPTRWVTKSVCWANKINQLLPGSIDGIAYDGQGFILGNEPKPVYDIVHSPGNTVQTLGWVSGGPKSNVDINFIEIYDLYKGNHNLVRIDTVTPDDAYKYKNITKVFPGNQKDSTIGPNISNCAIDSSNALCNQYSKYIDTKQPASDQVIQSWNFIYNFTSSAPFIYDSAVINMKNDNVVFVFSTQNKGKVGEYIDPKTGKGATTTISNCFRLQFMKPIPSDATCGDENGFGSWYQPSNNFNPLQEFKAATSGFLTGACQGTVNANCDYNKNNMGGIWQYDYIPQSWLSGST